MLERATEAVIPYSAEELNTLLRNLLPGYVILIPFLDVIEHFASEFNFLGFVAEFYLVLGLLIGIASYGIYELFRPITEENDEWKTGKIIEKFGLDSKYPILSESRTKQNKNERWFVPKLKAYFEKRAHLREHARLIVRLYKHLQNEFIPDQHEDAHRLTSYMIFFGITSFGTLIASILRLIYNLTTRSFSALSISFFVAGLFIFASSCIIAMCLSAELKKVDLQLITILRGNVEACKELDHQLAAYYETKLEKGISNDAIVSFLSNKDMPNNQKLVLKVILEVRKSGVGAGKICLPGGHSLMSDDDLRNTAWREVHEETPLSIEPDKFKFFGVYDKKDRDACYVSICYYVNLEDYPELNKIACDLENNPNVPEHARSEVREYKFLPLNKDSIKALSGSFAFQHDKILLDFIDSQMTKTSNP
jgi:ADP-ribose pyrophosphatase YjhB (NUDIX family)